MFRASGIYDECSFNNGSTTQILPIMEKKFGNKSFAPLTLLMLRLLSPNAQQGKEL